MTNPAATTRTSAPTILLRGIVGILGVSVLCAGAFHAFAPGGLLRSPDRTRKLMTDHATLHRPVAEMSAEQAIARLGGRSSHDAHANLVVVDARPRWEFERGHIPSAIHIPAAASAIDRRARLNRAIGQNLESRQDIDRSVPILVYCGPDDCGLDLLLARALMTDGFDRVYRLRGGLPAWKNAGGAVETVELLQETSD